MFHSTSSTVYVTVLAVCLLLYCAKTFMTRTFDPHRYVVVDLAAFKGGSGLGNLVFELIGSIALAKKLQRTLVVDRKAYEKMQNCYPEFTNLIAEIRWDIPRQQVPLERVFDYHSFHCCRFNPAINNIESSRAIITVKLQYLQSFKYFESISLDEVRNLLGVSDNIRSIAREKLIEKSYLNRFDHKICVHSRRGDFLYSLEQAPSTEDFTIPAVHFILEKLNATTTMTKPLLIMIGDDFDWQKELATRINHTDSIVLPRSKHSNSPAIDWQFSEIYCDTVLLSASSSTFGWWLAFVSKGQQVFYNSKYAKGDNFADHFDPDDFFPHHWTALELNGNQHASEITRFSNI